jgi:hypothetical protein
MLLTAGGYYIGDYSFLGGSIFTQCSLESNTTLDNNLASDDAIYLDATATIREDAVQHLSPYRNPDAR